jgi:3-hydroxyisobutyrate dehydrogenase-like beta-hydroxyacid dehydrogenase
MKALNNAVAAATYCATAEALVVGRRFGLDPQTMIDIIKASTGRSFVSERSGSGGGPLDGAPGLVGREPAPWLTAIP